VISVGSVSRSSIKVSSLLVEISTPFRSDPPITPSRKGAKYLQAFEMLQFPDLFGWSRIGMGWQDQNERDPVYSLQ